VKTITIVRGWEWQIGDYRIRRNGMLGQFYSVKKQDEWHNWLTVSVHRSMRSATLAIGDLTIEPKK
jgi:hypothetical protein